MAIKYKCSSCGGELQGSGLRCYLCGGAPRISFTDSMWEKAPWPEETPLLPDDVTVPAPGPIESRIADSYAALIERAEQAEREVERLKEENGQVKKLLRRLFNKAIAVATCLRHGQLQWAVEKGEDLDERICEVEAYEEKHGSLT